MNDNLSYEDARQDLLDEIKAGLPKPENLLAKTQNYALDQLKQAKLEQNDENIAHYTAVLTRLANITKR